LTYIANNIVFKLENIKGGLLYTGLWLIISTFDFELICLLVDYFYF